MLDNTKLFTKNGKDFTYEDLLKQIYVKSEYRDSQIEKVVSHISSIIQNSGDAVVLAPTIAKYLETAVKNDDNLVKLAGVVSRLIKPAKTTTESDDYGLTDEEKRKLNEEIFTQAEKILKR